MPIAEYRMAAGTLSYSELLSNSAYIIENWTRATDMGTGRVWVRPTDEAERVFEDPELIQSMDGRRAGYGRPEFDWILRALTPGMVKYIRDTFFSTTGYSANVTVSTYNRQTGEWEVYNAVANRPSLDSAELVAGGLDSYRISFVDCVKLDVSGIAFSSGFSGGFY